MTKEHVDLPIDVLSRPRWRVNFRPLVHRPIHISSIARALEIVTQNRVALRGWDFPHISSQNKGYGPNWVASWSDFVGHLEYWRFYQSAQFLYLGSIGEVTEPDWNAKIRETMKNHLKWNNDINVNEVPGFISIVNLVYTVTEVFEFAARLSQSGIYEDALKIHISLIDIKGFLLAADANRLWHSAYAATERELHREVTLTPAALVSTSANEALSAIVWFFERFGWLQPPIEVLREDQQKLITGRI